MRFFLLSLLLASPLAAQLPNVPPTPREASITPIGNDTWHIILPANRRDVSIPNPNRLFPLITNAIGRICWDPNSACPGPGGATLVPNRDGFGRPEDFVSPSSNVGSIVTQTANGRTRILINDRDNDGAFVDNRGFFDFHLQLTDPAALTASTTNWLKSNAIPLSSPLAGTPTADLQPLKDIIGGARIVQLGEATHGSREFFQLKHRLLEYLATEMGFNIFAIEAYMAEAEAINDYVLTGNGDPKALLNRLGFWTWNTEEVLAMIRWMRDFNASGKGPLKFMGFDMQSATVSTANVQSFLAKADPPFAAEVARTYASFTTPGATVQGFSNFAAAIPGNVAAGKTIRLSGFIRTVNITRGYAGLWLRVDGPSGALFLDNMSNRGLSGTTDWTQVSITTTVPQNATNIVFGGIHPGDGTALWDTFSIDIDGAPFTDPRLDFSFDTPNSTNGFGLSNGSGAFAIGFINTVAHQGAQSIRSSYLNPPAITPAQAFSLASSILQQMDSSRDKYLAAGLSPTEIEWAIQHARLITQFQQNRLTNIRDLAMAQNIKWIHDYNPNAKIVVWAHNGHVQNSADYPVIPMGDYLRQWFGDSLRTFGFSLLQGRFQAYNANLTAIVEHSIPPSPPGSLDQLLSSAGHPLAAFDLRFTPPTNLLRAHLPTNQIGSVYNPALPSAYFNFTNPQSAYDAIFFFQSTTRAQPVQ